MLRTLSASMGVALALAAVSVGAGPKQVPAQIALARYVCLGYDTGDRFLSDQESISTPYDIYPEDRAALNSIRDAIEKWGKYTLTVRPDQAELLIAVRRGRRAGAKIGITGGGRGGGAFGATGGIGGAQLSSGDDMLTIYESRSGRPGAQLWRVQRGGALSGNPPRAFEEFRTDVERAQPPAPANKP